MLTLLRAFLFSEPCLFCDRVNRFTPILGVCLPCLRRLKRFTIHPECGFCGDDHEEEDWLCQSRNLFWDSLQFLWRAGPKERQLIHACKSGVEYRFTGTFGVMGKWKPPLVDSICLVPSRDPARGRFFHPSERLVQRIAAKHSIPVLDNLLRKDSKDRQATKKRWERFKHASEAWKLNFQPLPGTKILLVDDIFTTGASLGAIAKILKEVGVKEVHCLVSFRSTEDEELLPPDLEPEEPSWAGISI